MKKVRLDYLDVAKGFGILSVVLAHVSTEDDLFVRWVHSFGMQLFFIVTGFVLKLTAKKKVGFFDNMKSKFLALLVPYYVFSIPFVLVQFYIGGFEMEDLIYNIADTIFFTSYSALWFLPTMFFADVSFSIYRRLRNKVIRVVIFIATFIVPYAVPLLLGLEELSAFTTVSLRSFAALGFLIIGYNLFEAINESKIKLYEPMIILIITMGLSLLTDPPDLFALSYGNPFIYVFNSIMGALSTLAIFKILDNKLWIVGKYLKYFGSNSLIIMATHENLIELIPFYLSNLEFTKTVRLGMFVLIMIIEVFIILFINTFCGWPIGKKKRKFFNKMYKREVTKG